MPKRRIGLQKDISSIFKGVPISTDKGVSKARHTPILEPPRYTPAEPISPDQTVSAEPKVQTEIKQVPSIPKRTPSKKPVPDVAVRASKRTPVQQSLQQMRNKLFAPKPGVSHTRQKAVVVLVPVLAIVLILVLTQVFSKSSGRVTKDKQDEATTSVTGSSNEIDWQIPPPYPATLRDPMQFSSLVSAQAEPDTAETTETETERLIIKSILHSESKPSVVIGTQIVHEGDSISGATVVTIDKDKVEFEKDGKRWIQKVER